MSFSFGTSSGAAGTKPSRGTATMADWKTWVDGLSRYERDQLYPGMHKDLIPAWEMIEAQEERKQQGYTQGLSTDTGSATAPSLPAASPSSGVASPGPVSSTSNPSRPKGLLDIDYTTFKPGALTANTGFGTGLSRSAPAQTPSNTLFGSSAYTPYQPYIPPSYGQPLSPAPTPPMPMPMPMPVPAPVPFSGFAPTLAPGLANPVGTAPAQTGFSPTVFGTTVPSLLSGTPFNTAPVPAPTTAASLFAAPGLANPAPAPLTTFGNPLTTAPATSPLFAAAAGLPAPATPGTSPSSGPTAPLKGLLDQSYVKSPAGDAMGNAAAEYSSPRTDETPQLTQGTANRGTGSSTRARNAQFSLLGDAWDKLTEIVDDTIKVTTEGIQYANEFAKYLVDAPRDEQLEFLTNFGIFLGTLTGAGDAVRQISDMVRHPENRTLIKVAALIIGLLPIVRALKAGPKFYRFIDRATKKFRSRRNARRAGKNDKPADVPKNPVPATQTKAKGGDRDGDNYANSRSSSGLFTRTPKVRDFFYGGIEAVGWEAFDQFFSANILPIQGEPGFAAAPDKFLVAFLTGGLAGVSSGFESEGAADIVVQSIIDPVSTGLHTWLMRGLDEGSIFSETATMAGGTALLAAQFAKLAKILLFSTLSEAIETRLSSLSPGFRRWLRRQLKIAVNRIVDRAAEFLVANLKAP